MPSLSAYCRSIEHFHPEMVEVVRSRPYRMPKGYISWQQLSAIIAANMALVKEGNAVLVREDLATRITALRTTQWFLADAPLYCLSLDLLRAFEQADVSNLYELFRGFETTIPTFLIALPENAVRLSEGGALQHLCVHVADRAHPERSEAQGFGIKVPYLRHDGEKNVHISSIDGRCNTWVSGLTPDRTGKLYDSGKILADPMSLEDMSDAGRMKKIGLQCLLALAYSPELMGEPSETGSLRKTTTRHQAKQEKLVMRQPRWLKQQKSLVIQRPPQGGSHASPRPHWRAAHQRRVPVGPRELGDRKVVKIGPTWVNGNEQEP